MTRQRQFWLLIPAIWLFFYLALSSMVMDSPTMDEQNHIARGVALWQTGDPRLSLEHPPLINGLSGLLVQTGPTVRLPTDHPSWEQPQGWYQFADLLLWEYGNDVTRIIFLGRMPIIFLTLALALVGYHFARLLWGEEAAPFAFLLLLFDPNLLAHGRYITTDMGGTLFVFLVTLLLWRLWQQATWQWRLWGWLVLGLGAAFASKLSALVFVPIWLLLAVAFDLTRQRGQGWRCSRQLLTAGLASLFVIWGVFAFEVRPFFFQTAFLSQFNNIAGPMPTYWAGIEQIVAISGGGRPAFLLGAFSDEGFWNYFPVAFASKTPLALLVGAPVALVALARARQNWGRLLFLLVPVLAYFLFSMQSSLNIGYRHLLPMLPFLYLLVAGLGRRWAGKGERGLLVGITAVLLMTSLWIHPHYLSFFNVLVGGPEAGHHILVDSNIDWGQDLFRLQAWMAENGIETVKLGWFGTADPTYYGLQHEPLPGFPRLVYYRLWYPPPFNVEAPEPGIYAISVSNLWEAHWQTKITYPWFRERLPDARIGYSIFIYDLRE